ncbi:MAG: hypothetical protein PHC84_04515 [Clostridia bacterium]|nr:hypothetical protein [Clostridia bacterium]
MSKKSRIEEEIQPQARPMMRASYRIVNPMGAIPVARPSSNIQLTPIVQPVSFVPYSTQGQPILTVDEDYDY